MKSLLIMILLAAPAFAETPVIDFVEWVLETRLTGAERTLLEKNPIDQKTADGLLQVQQKIASLPAAQQEAMHKQVQDAFLNSLRANPNDDASRVLLAAYQRGRTATKPQLAGTWSLVQTSTVTYQDRATGSFAPPSGSGTTWHIFPDGTWRSETLMQSSLYNCTMNIFVVETGTLRVNGTGIVFDSQGGDMDSKDNCRRDFNYQKKIPGRQYTYSWRIAQDEYGKKLCLAEAGKAEICYSRK